MSNSGIREFTELPSPPRGPKKRKRLQYVQQDLEDKRTKMTNHLYADFTGIIVMAQSVCRSEKLFELIDSQLLRSDINVEFWFDASSADMTTSGSQAVGTSLPLTRALRRRASTPSRPAWLAATNVCIVTVSKFVVYFANTVDLNRSHKNFAQYVAWQHAFISSLYSCSLFSTVPESVLSDNEVTGNGQHVRVRMVWINCVRERERERERAREAEAEREKYRERQRESGRKRRGR